MNESLCLQKNYHKEDLVAAKEGCLAFCLLWSSFFAMRGMPSFSFETRGEVLVLFEKFKKEGWLEKDFFVTNPIEILSYLSGKNFEILTNEKYGILGKSHFLPPYFPTPTNAITLGCFREKEDSPFTHFVVLNSKNEIIFDPMGRGYLDMRKNDLFLSDKRVYILGQK